MTSLELLAPAKNLTLGKAAIDHGADALYIGAPQFGARSAAGNPVSDIAALCQYAHFYKARVYVALNTLLFDHELEDARRLVYQLWDAGVDALIVQDMALVEMDLPPIPLFASTQTDNQTPEKVAFLEKSGFERVILARELGLDDIKKIRAATRVDLEAFVHGALCVCFSGQCYMSAAIGGRSANRGACGQPCRLPWNLVSPEGEILSRDKYLLSLKDMDRSAHLKDLAAAGITSFKIEGRLKDMAYVKNITAFYRRHLDRFMAGQTGFEKASSGKVIHSFSPNPFKTFNRGTTDYYLKNPGPGQVHSFESPKSRGEKLGSVAWVGPDSFRIKGDPDIHNGDGLCFVDPSGKLTGFRVNKVDHDGRIFPPGNQPMKKIPLQKGDQVFRNHDKEFVKTLEGPTADRRIGLDLQFFETPKGIGLKGRDEDGFSVQVERRMEKEAARNPEQAKVTIEKQLTKLGNTRFYANTITLDASPLFIPSKALNQLRRDLVDALESRRQEGYVRQEAGPRPPSSAFLETCLDYQANVSNETAKSFYANRGVKTIAPAFEVAAPQGAVQVMETRHCIRYSLGACLKEGGKGARPVKGKGRDWQGPLYIENDKGRFKLVFDCKACRMKIMS